MSDTSRHAGGERGPAGVSAAARSPARDAGSERAISKRARREAPEITVQGSPAGVIKIVLPFVPESGKNRRNLAIINGVPRSFPNAKAKRQADWIKRAVQAAALGGLIKPFDDCDLAMRIEHCVTEDSVVIFVWKCGERPKGKTGRKRDLHNLSVLIPDALQGVLYHNDNQIALMMLERVKLPST